MPQVSKKLLQLKKELTMNGLPEKRCASDTSRLPYDIIFKILLLLPAKDLIRLSLVCKTWRQLMNSPNFVETHKSRCETVLTFVKHFSEPRPNTFSIDTTNGQFTLFEPRSSKKQKLHIYLMEFGDQKGKIIVPNICGFGAILATCDGLVLATNQTRNLLVFNPITRKILLLKSGTMVQNRMESYGFAFSDRTREYKVVHVFCDESGHVDGEVLSLTTMSWRGCKLNTPSFRTFEDFNHKPVPVSGILYWLPGTHNVNHIVSMDIDNEKFGQKTLPVNSTGMNNRLVENRGSLNFIAQMTVYRIQLWTLKFNDWVKSYTINMDYDITAFVPVFVTKNGRYLIFEERKGAIYEYDMEEEEMEKVLVDGNLDFNEKMVFPHMNTLVSWANSGPMW